MSEQLKAIYYILNLSGLFVLLAISKRADRVLLLFIPLYCSNVVTQILLDNSSISNPRYYLYHLNQCVSWLVFAIYYFSILKMSIYRFIVIFGSAVYIIYFIKHFAIIPANLFAIDFSDFVVEGAFVCIYSVCFLVYLYQEDANTLFYKNTNFWISTANLLFFSGCIVVMGFLHNLREYHKDLYAKVVYINYALNLLLYFLYIIAFLCLKKK